MSRSPSAKFSARRAMAMACVLAVAGLMALAPAALAQHALTVAEGGDVRIYELEDLQELDPVDIVTATPWTDAPERFTGVPLARLLAGPLTGGGLLRLVALNDYEIMMPLAEIGEEVPIVAHLREGRPMSIRDKGPFWIIYPFDAGEAFQSELIFSRSVWQLVRIEVQR